MQNISDTISANAVYRSNMHGQQMKNNKESEVV